MRAAPVLVALLVVGCAGPERAAPSDAPGAAVPSPAAPATTGTVGARPAATGVVQPSGSPGARRPREAASLAACPPRPLFSVLPVALDRFRAFRPLGFPQPPQHIFGAKHSAFTINLPGEPPVAAVPVRFPSDAHVTQITRTTGQQPGHQLVFFPCGEFKSYFFHLGALAPALAAAFDAAAPVCREQDFGSGGRITKCEASLLLAVRAGDPVGVSDGLAGVDWGGVDYRVRHAFINPSRYDGDYPHYVSPADYLTPDLRAQIAPRLASLDATIRRTAVPETGVFMQDVAGAAQGNWFTPGSSFMTEPDFSVWLGLLRDSVDPTVAVFSMGRSVPGIAPGLYAFVPRADGTVDRDFPAVRADGATYCYERFLRGRLPSGANLAEPRGILVLAMPDERTLLVEHRQAATCAGAAPPGARAARFER